jgi:hypothetical protein
MQYEQLDIAESRETNVASGIYSLYSVTSLLIWDSVTLTQISSIYNIIFSDLATLATVSTYLLPNC